MDLIEEVGQRFKTAAAKAGRRLSHGPRSKSQVRRGDRQDPGERLMDKIVKASRPDGLNRSESKSEPKKTDKTDKKAERPILPVPKDSAHG